MTIKSLLLATAAMFAAATTVHAQCVGQGGVNTIDTCAQAVSPQQGDEVLVYQPNQSPHTRKMALSSLLGLLSSPQILQGLGYTPLSPSNNLSDLADPVQARANLGIQANGTTSTGLMPTWTTPSTVSGNIAYNTAMGRFDFIEGGSAKNYVRLGGDTMTGTLVLSGGMTTANLQATNSTTQMSFKNAPSGTILLLMGGAAGDIQPKTNISLPGGTWGSGNLVNNRPPIFQNATFSGSATNSGTSLAMFLQQSDGSSILPTEGGTNGVTEHLTTTTGWAGWRQAGSFVLDLTGTSANTTGRDYVGLGSKCNLMATDPPSAPANGRYSACFGNNPVAHVGAGVSAGGIIGEEIDTWAESGAVMQGRIGLQIVDVTGSPSYGQQAVADDVALSLNNQYPPSSSLGFEIGMEFGRWGGSFPVMTGGTLIFGQANQANAFTVKRGLDWRFGTFTGDAIAIEQASLADNGTLRLGPAYMTPTASGLTIDPTGSYGTAGAIVAGGSGFTPSVATGGWEDGHGGIWKITANSSGVATSVVMQAAPYTGPGTAASTCTAGSPCTLTNQWGSPGSGATISVTWQTGTTLSLQPSGGATTVGGLAHFVQPASIQFDGTHTWSGTQAAVGTAEIYSFTNQSGSTTTGNPVAFHYFSVASDTLQAPNAGVISNLRSDLTTGAGIQGGRDAMMGNITIGGTPGDGRTYVAANFAAQASAPANASGNNLFGTNPTCGINGTATGNWTCVGEEIDIAARSGSAPTMLTGMTIVTVNGHVVHGSSNMDSAISIGNQPGTTTGWDYGLRFGGPGNAFPFVSAAKLIATWSGISGLNAADGVDFSSVTFSDAAFKSTGFQVDGSGAVTGSAYKVGATAGVTCSGAPTASYAVTNGIVTHC